MTTIVSGRFDTSHEAREARADLERIGVPPGDILLTGTEGVAAHPHVADEEPGTATGVLVGGGAGLLTGIGIAAIAAPVVAPIAAAGFVAAAATGALVGGAAGDLAATLTSGHGDGDAVAAADVPATLSAAVDEALVNDARHALAAHGADGLTQAPARASTLDAEAVRVPAHDPAAARAA